MTLGEARVRMDFNPSGDYIVAGFKETCAKLIDRCHEYQQMTASAEEKRLWALAMTAFEEGQMWAVKAVTI